MTDVVLCLGSNAPDAALQVGRAAHFVAAVLENIVTSGPYLSDPEKNASPHLYTNQIVKGCTALDYNSIHSLFKGYESRVRAASLCPGSVAVDIDIVVFDGRIERPLDYTSAYFRKGLRLIEE